MTWYNPHRRGTGGVRPGDNLAPALRGENWTALAMEARARRLRLGEAGSSFQAGWTRPKALRF